MAAPVEGSSSSTTTGALYQLISVGLLFVALIFTIVAAATTGWIHVGTTKIGLFTVCGGGYCQSTLDAFSNQSSCQSRDQAAQAFIVLAILVIFPLLCLVAIRRFIGSTQVGQLVNQLPWFIDVITAGVILLFLTITWGAVANYYDECVCNNTTAACGLNYSWALCFIAWFCILVTGILLFLSRGEIANAVQPVEHNKPQEHNAQHSDASHAA